MDPERLAQIREHIRQGRAFLRDSHELLEEVDRLTDMTVRLAETRAEFRRAAREAPINVGGKRPSRPPPPPTVADRPPSPEGKA